MVCKNRLDCCLTAFINTESTGSWKQKQIKQNGVGFKTKLWQSYLLFHICKEKKKRKNRKKKQSIFSKML